MVITYFGESCYRVQSGDTSVLVNPMSNRLKATVTLRTLVPANVAPPRDEIVYPGEYEVGGMEIRGWLAAHESTDTYLKTAYLVVWEGMRIGFLGHLGKWLDDEDATEAFTETDVVFVPIGGYYFSPAEAMKLAKKFDPAIIVPGSYAPRDAKASGEFVRAAGAKVRPEDKFVFKKKDLAGARRRIVLLAAQGAAA